MRVRSTKSLAVAAALVAVSLLIGIPLAAAEDPPKQDSAFVMKSSVLGSAGGLTASPNFSGYGTLGQPSPVGLSETAVHKLHSGYWKWVFTWLAEAEDIPREFRNALYQNRPNPTRTPALIQYSVAQEGKVRLVIYDINGRRVRTLVDDPVAPGLHRALWDGRCDGGARAGSGVYFYRIQVGDYRSVKKMLVIR